MPHFWNNILVVTEPELVPVFYNTLKTLQSEISRYKDKDYGIKKVQSGGNGRQLLVAFDSLSAEIKNAIGDPRKNEHLLELFYETDKLAVQYYTKDFRHEDGSTLSLQHQEEYITNASVLQACGKLKQQRINTILAMGGNTRKIMSSILSDAQSFNATLRVKHGVQHTLPESEKRFKETFKGFFTPTEKYPVNYGLLISGKLKNQNTRKVTDNVMSLLNELFAGQGTKPSRSDVTRVYNGFLQGYIECINTATGELYNPKDYKPLSDATIINYLGSWAEAIGTESKRSGDRQKLMGKFKTYHSLNKPVYAGSIISVDDRQPPFEYAPGERAWFYMGIDLASEAWTTWVWGKSKEGIITEFYRQMVRNYAEWGLSLPAELEAEAALNSSFTGTFLQEGRMFSHVRIEANNARGKRVERYFGELRYGIEKQREGWIARPFAQRESNQAGPQRKVIRPYGEIVDECLSDIEKWNNMPHSSDPTISRWDYFMRNQHPDLRPINWHAILPYLGYVTKTSVSNSGIIHLNNEEFLLGDEGKVYRGQRLIDAMELVGGERVSCVWLDDNNGNVLKAFVMLNDRIICEAVRKPRYSRGTIERTPADYEAQTAMSAYVETIDAYMRDKRNSINEIVVIDNTPTLPKSFTIARPKQVNDQDGRQLPTGGSVEVLPDLPNDITIPNDINHSFIKSTRDRL